MSTYPPGGLSTGSDPYGDSARPCHLVGLAGQDKGSGHGRRVRVEIEEDEFIYDAVRLFLEDNSEQFTVRKVLDGLREKWPGKRLTREQVYPAIREGFRRGYLVFTPPENLALAQRIADILHLPASHRVHVVNAQGLEHVASAAAHVVYQAMITMPHETIRIGLGVGAAVRWTTKFLGCLLRADYSFDKRLRVVAMATPEHLHESPDVLPVSFARYLEIGSCSFELICEEDGTSPEPLELAIGEASECLHTQALEHADSFVLLALSASGLSQRLPPSRVGYLVVDLKTARQFVEQTRYEGPCYK